MSLHSRIREERVKRGWSVNAFAKRLGVTSTCAWNWDHENTSPRPERIKVIADVLGVSEAYLLTGVDKEMTAQSPSDTLDTILDAAKARIAGLLGIEASRIKLDFSLI